MELVQWLDVIEKVAVILAAVATIASVIHNWNKE